MYINITYTIDLHMKDILKINPQRDTTTTKIRINHKGNFMNNFLGGWEKKGDN